MPVSREILSAARSGDNATIRELLRKGCSLNAMDITKRHKGIVLVEKSPGNVTYTVRIVSKNEVPQYAGTVVHFAAAEGRVHTVKYLLSLEANPPINLDLKAGCGATAREIAIANGHLQIVAIIDDYLLKKQGITAPAASESSICFQPSGSTSNAAAADASEEEKSMNSSQGSSGGLFSPASSRSLAASQPAPLPAESRPSQSLSAGPVSFDPIMPLEPVVEDFSEQGFSNKPSLIGRAPPLTPLPFPVSSPQPRIGLRGIPQYDPNQHR